MALPFYNWSRTAASNASADATVNWAENQAPSSVNDSARAMMASVAAFRDDIAGGITTGGSATAYTVTSYQVFDTLAHLAGQRIGFIPHATNTNAVGVDVTLNVDGLGAKSVRMQPSVALPGGTLVLGTPYIVTYNNSDAVFYLQNMTNPYIIPVAGELTYWGTTVPNSSFALMYGQAISRTTYATLFTLLSTTFGVGDGSTTFNIPDLRGRVTVGKDDMGGSAASRLTTAGGGVDGVTLGAVGGAQNVTLAAAQIPPLSITSVSVASGTTNLIAGNLGTAGALLGNAGSTLLADTIATGTLVAAQRTSTGTGAYANASQTATKTVMPAIVSNKLLRII